MQQRAPAQVAQLQREEEVLEPGSTAISGAQARAAKRLSPNQLALPRAQVAERRSLVEDLPKDLQLWTNPQTGAEQRSEDAPTELPSHQKAQVHSFLQQDQPREVSAGRGDRWAA